MKSDNPFRKQPGLPQTGDPDVDAFNEMERELAWHAFEAQGIAAFSCPIASAALHEAGHRVIDRLFGRTVTECKVYPSDSLAAVFSDPCWFGFCGSGPREVSWGRPESDVRDDLDEAARFIAGLTSERLFDEVFHQGSALYEQIMFESICNVAAGKLGRDPDDLQAAVLATVERHLRANASAHHMLTTAIIEHHTVPPSLIATILAEVTPIGPRQMFVSEIA